MWSEPVMFALHQQATPSARPAAASHTSQWHDDETCPQFPPMPSSTVLPDSASHMRPRTSVAQSPKRFSVFGGRSRSNTATSSSSSYKSPASSMTSVEGSSQRSSQDGRTLSTVIVPLEKQERIGRSLFSRGSRILRRQGSKFSLSSAAVLDEADGMAKDKLGEKSKEKTKEKEKIDGLGIFYRSHRLRHSDMHDLIKRNISEPFDFQHVTHTSPSQLPPLDDTASNSLATEFSVIQASQRPGSELKGIRAVNIHSRNFSSDDVSSVMSAPVVSDLQSCYATSPPQSPEPRDSPRSPRFGIKRASRSYENFSRPVSRLQKRPLSPSIIPPPRVSSKLACSPGLPEPTCQTIDALIGAHSPPTFPEDVYSTTGDVDKDGSSLSQLNLAKVSHPDVGSAVTTEDGSIDMARALTLNNHPSELEDVPEEDETSLRRNSCEPNPQQQPSASGSHFQFRPSRSNFDKPLSQAPCSQALGTSLDPEELGSPTIPTNGADFGKSQFFSDIRDPKNRLSVGVRPVAEDSWEDDIDYCYEHAAESNCNFDWVRTSLNVEDTTELIIQTAIDDIALDKPPAVPQIPERSAERLSRFRSERADQRAPYVESTRTSHGAGDTVVNSDSTESIRHEGYQTTSFFNPDPVHLLAAPSGDLSHDPIYEESISDIQENEDYFPFDSKGSDHLADRGMLSRSSSSPPISKYNSEESIILSRAGSVARKHRSSMSTTASVPDLVHSANSSRETVDRDTLSLSTELPQVGFLGAVLLPPRPHSSALHYRSRSLAREVSHRLAPINTSSLGNNNTEKSPLPTTPTHDRAKSASAVETLSCLDSVQSDKSFVSMKHSTFVRGIGNRKARTSYSLFPVATSPPAR